MDKFTIWFDGSYLLRRREIMLMKRLDCRRAIDFIDAVASHVADCRIDRAKLLAGLHARENGVLLPGAGGFAAMWSAILPVRTIAPLACTPQALTFLERCHAAYLRVRPRLQRMARSPEFA